MTKTFKQLCYALTLVCLISCGDNKQNNMNTDNSSFKKRIINPCTWQNNRGFVQANELTGARRILFTAGQVSVDAEGNLLYPGDMEKQIHKTIDNLEAILKQAGFKLSDIVKMTYYTTDVKAFTKVNIEKQPLMNRLSKAGCKPATSLIGVNELFHPDCVVEIEATLAD